MSYKLKLTFDQLPKSLNRKLRSNRFINNKENKMWDLLIRLNCKIPSAPLKRAKIKITRFNYRFLDFDGLVGSMKPVVDGLVDAGVLVDDSWPVVGSWDVDQVFRKKKDGQMLQIEVTELID